MDIKEILARIGYIRNKANLSAREVSQRMGMSPQYVAQIESGRIVLKVEKLLQILKICEFPIERFFSSNIEDYNIDIELKNLIESLPTDKKKNIIEFIKKWLVRIKIMKLKEAVAKRIKEIMKEKDITQYQLFKCSGVPQSTISTILNSETKTVKLSSIYDICSGLNIELSDFFDCNYLKLKNLDD